MRSFIITGEKAQREKYIKSFIEKESILPHSIIEYTEEIKIKEARSIRLSLSRRHSDKRLIIISSKINAVSQNTLLKSFEELPDNTSIVISTDDQNEILDTIKSRLFLVNVDRRAENEAAPIGLIDDDLVQRFQAVDKFINDNNSSDPKVLVDEFLLAYRTELVQSLDRLNKRDVKSHLFIMKNLMKVSNLVKFNNLNLRLGLESAVLK